MNWGNRLKELITRNWREKIISVVLAFLLWYMIKAQDVRVPPAYLPPQPVKMSPTIPAPAQLAPTLQPDPQVPAQLAPVVPPPAASAAPTPQSGIGIDKPAGL